MRYNALAFFGVIGAVVSLAWSLFILLSHFIWSSFFSDYALSTTGIWPAMHVAWAALTVVVCVGLLSVLFQRPSRLALFGFILAVISITITIFIIAPLLWQQAIIVS